MVLRKSKKNGPETAEDPPYEVTDEFCQLQDDDFNQDFNGNVDRIQVVENIKEFLASPFEIITRDIEDDIM